MSTIPEAWEKHKTFPALARAECSCCVGTKGRCIEHRPARPLHLAGPVEVTCRRHYGVVVEAGKPTSDTSARCVLLLKEPQRCPRFERSLLPAAPRAVVEEYLAAFPDCRVAFKRLEDLHGESSDKPCPDCGRPKPKGKQYCAACRERRRRASRVRRQRKWRSVSEPVDTKSNLEAPETTDSEPKSRGKNRGGYQDT